MRIQRFLTIAILIGLGVLALLMMTWNPWAAQSSAPDASSTGNESPRVRTHMNGNINPTEIWNEIQEYRPEEGQPATAHSHPSQNPPGSESGSSRSSGSAADPAGYEEGTRAPDRLALRVGGPADSAAARASGADTIRLSTGVSSSTSTAASQGPGGNVPPPSAQPNPSPVTPGRIHKVRKGESLSTISKAYLGSANQWKRIADANLDRLKNPAKLRVGMEILIPERSRSGENSGSSIERRPVAGDAPAVSACGGWMPPGAKAPVGEGSGTAGPGQDSAASAEDSAPKEATRTYVMAPGDTLSSVSKRFYGTTQKWKNILEANRGVIKNPKNIRPGVSLVIP